MVVVVAAAAAVGVAVPAVVGVDTVVAVTAAVDGTSITVTDSCGVKTIDVVCCCCCCSTGGVKGADGRRSTLIVCAEPYLCCIESAGTY